MAALVALVIAVLGFPFPEERLGHDTFESTRVRDRYGRLLRESLSDADGRATAVRTGAEVDMGLPPDIQV